MRILHLGDLGDVLVGVGVVDLVEGEDGGEFLVGEGADDGADGFGGPVLERLFEFEVVEGAGYGLGGAAIAGELVLEGFDWIGLCDDEPQFSKQSRAIGILMAT